MNAPIPPSPDAVRARAYEIYLRRGATPGRAISDWLEAERQVREEAARRLPQKPQAPAAAEPRRSIPAPTASPASSPPIPGPVPPKPLPANPTPSKTRAQTPIAGATKRGKGASGRGKGKRKG